MARKLRIASTLTLPIEFVTETIALLAIKGAGKTYGFLKIAEEMISAGLPVVILDHVGVCWGLRSSASGKGPGLPVYVLGGEHGDAPLEAHAGELVARWQVATRASVVLDMSAFAAKADERRFVAAFCDALYRKNRKPVHLMIDETDEYAPQKPKGEAIKSLSSLEIIVRRGRARGIGITMATQRPAVLNKDVLTQAGTLMFGRVVSPHDRDAVKKWLAGQTSAHNLDQIVNALPSMARGAFQFWSPAYDIFKEIEIGERKTFDSSATPKYGRRIKSPKAVAKVDLRALSEDMKAAREQQEASDPSRLRRRIAELEQAVKKANDTAIHLMHISPKPAPAKPPKPIKVPVMTKAERAMLVKIAALSVKQTALLAQLASDGAKVSPAIERLTQKIFARFDRVIQEHPRDQQQRVIAAPGRVDRRPSTPTPAKSGAAPTPGRGAPVTRKAVAVGASAAAESNGSLKLGGQMLNVLRAACQLGRTNQKQLGVMLGVKAKGTTLRAYCQRLTHAGLLVKEGDDYVPTAAGRTAAGDFDPLPTTRAELITHWRNRLGGQMREIFDMVANEDEPISEDDIAEQLHIAAKGTTIRAYLQRLARLGVISRQGGTVSLSDQFDRG
jgi:hypothetical protein